METTLTQNNGTWHPVGPGSELPPGEMMGVEIGSQRIVIYNVDGEFYATHNVCTHAFALLSDGWLEDDVIECPLHAGRFNVRTGKALGDPVECDLQIFPTRLVDGAIEVFVPNQG